MHDNLNCDLCDSTEVEPAYKPKDSQRALEVYICKNCGLVQSFPKVDHVKHRNIAVSGGADWGNIRYGKQFRTSHDIEIISRFIDIKSINRCLDIGSNRGHFYSEIKKISSKNEFWCVEPDLKIMAGYSSARNNDHIINDRVENVQLPEDYYDLIYCSHTIEHLKSPKSVAKQIFSSLKNGGIAYVEVPNIEFLNTNDIIEEWFIDKHLYHFSRNVFKKYFQDIGFKIKYESGQDDKSNISLLLQKENNRDVSKHVNEYIENRDLINRYSNVSNRNRLRIKLISNELNNIAKTKRLVVRGGGRIFDNLVNIGGLDPHKIHGLIDRYLYDYVDETNDVDIKHPSALEELNPEFVFICSREYYMQIRNEIIESGLTPEIDSYSNMFKKC